MDKPVDKEIEALRPIETPPDMLKAMQGLIEDGENDVARLPEHLFLSNLLPVLTDTSGNADLTVWLDIAGHGFRPIDVYDASTGQTLFRVPSLYSRRPTKPIGDSRHSLALLAHQANQYGTQHPAIAQTFLRNSLAARAVDQQVDWATVRQWNAILERYGLPPVAKMPENGLPASATASPPRTPNGLPNPMAHEVVSTTPGALTASDAQDDF